MDLLFLRTEVALEDLVHTRFQYEAVVHCDQLHLLVSEPARLSATGHTVIHDVISNEKECLQKLDAPAEGGRLHSFFVRERSVTSESGLHGHESEATIHFAASHGVPVR